MEELRLTGKLTSKISLKEGGDSKAKLEIIQRWNAGECNVQSLFQNCFKDKETSTRLIDLYKKYSKENKPDNNKTKLSTNSSEVSSNFKQSKEESKREVKKNSKDRKKLKETLDRIYLDCNKAMCVSRSSPLFESRLFNIVQAKQTLFQGKM